MHPHSTDLALKALTQQAPESLRRLVMGVDGPRVVWAGPAAELVQVNRRPDVVLELEDGRRIHVELETDPGADLVLRALEYHTLLTVRMGLVDDGPVPLETVVVLARKPSRRFSTRLTTHGLAFSMRLVRLYAMSAAELATDPWLAVFTAAAADTSPVHLKRAQATIRSTFAHEPRRAADLLVAMLLVGRTTPEDFAQLDRKELMMSSFAKYLFDEGRKEGREEGREEGMERGLEQGLEEQRKALRQAARVRFRGTPHLDTRIDTLLSRVTSFDRAHEVNRLLWEGVSLEDIEARIP